MTIATTPQYDPAHARLNGRIALVTGGTRGIGRGISRALAAAGAQVVVIGRDEAAGREVVDEIAAAGGRASSIAADLADDAVVDALLAAAIQAAGPIDILVNNAGIDADAPALDYELDAWRRIMRFNLEVPFRLCQQAARHFIPRGGGAIINVASVLGHVGAVDACSYVSAKHGLVGLTKTLAMEWARLGIRVNAISPGLIQTDMTKYVWASEASQRYVDSRIPQGRIGQPRDLGGAVVFLASEAASFIQGETIVVDGGFLAT